MLRRLLLALACVLGLQAYGQKTMPGYIINGMFFSEFPEHLEDKELETALIGDGLGNHAIVIKDAVLTAADSLLAIPNDKVADAEEWLRRAADGNVEFNRLVVKYYSGLDMAVGDMVKPFCVRDVDGRVWSNDSLLGRPYVLNFWHTGCGPCKREMPEISRWIDECPGAAFLAVTFDRAAAIRPIVEERGFRFVQIAGDETLWSMFGVKQVPATVLVGKDGRIRKITIGTNERKRADMLAAIKAACAE